jgi:flagellar motility protein MotE (MotC chaperone)
LEEELQRQKVELDKRIQQLEGVRRDIASILKDRVEVDQQKVDKLVDLYSNMKPKQAADVMSSLNEDLAVEILSKMKKKNAAEIMNLLPPEKARILSEKYTGYQQKHPDKKG